MDTCTGYACPPENGVPSSTLIVEQPTAPDNLATTGVDPTQGILLGAALIFASIALYARRRLNRG